ncbi:MAG: HEAT repeat domain-containing protein [Chloroflexota bacterium]
MGFDVENFGIGLLAGWGSAYAIYRARRHIGHIIRWTRHGASDAQRYATQNAESRYVKDLIRRAERMHLAGEIANLSDLLIEPRFIAPRPPRASDDDDESRDVFDTVPLIHDHPYLHAPYHIDTLSIDDLAIGDHALALLGEPGSGRTTALLAIALYCLNHVQFKPPIDKVQQKLDAEDARLSEKERATRIRERITMQQRARERLASERGDEHSAADDDRAAELPLLFRLMPVYVHMADIPLMSDEFGPEVDPAEPLVRGVQFRAGRVTAKTIPRNLYRRLNKGGVLLLIDGFDDLPATDQPVYAGWLKALIAQYGQNFFIVSGPASGYAPLVHAGLTPVYLRPWSDQDSARAAGYWANIWQKLVDKRRKDAKAPDDAQVRRASQGNRGLSAFEITLKLWATYAEDATVPGPDGWLRAFFARQLGHTEVEERWDALSRIAALQIERGYISKDELERSGIQDSPATAGDEDTGSGDRTRGPVAIRSKLLESLRQAGLLVRYSGDRYQFRHPLLAAYLAGQTLHGDTAALEARALDNAWSRAIGYAALATPIDVAVRKRLAAQNDFLRENLLVTARWLAYANPDVPWRAQVLKQLGNLMVATSQFPLVRERAAAALLTTRDATVIHIFRRAVRNANPHVRRLACIGLGALGQPEGVRDLTALVTDHDPQVQIAASIGLSAIPTEEAIEALLISLTEGSEQVRQAAAIAFAAMPEEGYPILHEAIADQDMMIRRAAIFGLRRIRTTWALIDIYRAFLEDEQWYVRSAAQQAFQESQFGRDRAFSALRPNPAEMTWLEEWAGSKGESVPQGDGALQLLVRALQDAEPEVRALAALALGSLGIWETMKPLYGALRDRHEEVRAAAYRALGSLQQQLGSPLPAP